MELKLYFETTEGLGVLSTADNEGRVDAAVYSRPHFLDDGRVAFIMRDRLTHHNLQTNPHAVYLFKERNTGYQGKRLFLTKVAEEKETELLYTLRRRTYPEDSDRRDSKYLVFFKINQTLPLVGSGTE